MFCIFDPTVLRKFTIQKIAAIFNWKKFVIFLHCIIWGIHSIYLFVLSFSTQTDVWAFGCLIVEVYTKSRPYPDLDTPMVMNGVINEHMHPHIDNENWDPELCELLTECWSFNPSERPCMYTLNSFFTHSEEDKILYKSHTQLHIRGLSYEL